MIWVGMPCYNRAAFTERTVRALATHEPRDSYTLVAVNDASTDRTADVLYALQLEGLVDYVIDHNERKGVPASVNEAWRIGEDDASNFVKLDNDSEILTPGLFARLRETIEAFGVGMAAPQVVPGPLGPVVRAGDVVARRPPGNLNGALLFATREVFERIGYFWEWRQPYSYADAEYCFRCRRAGLDHLYLPEKPGYWINHLDDGDRRYLNWKLRLRRKHINDWRRFQGDVKSGRIPVKQPFRITGER